MHERWKIFLRCKMKKLRCKVILLANKIIFLRCKVILLANKIIFLRCKIVLLANKIILFVCKVILLASKMTLFVCKIVLFASKIILFASKIVLHRRIFTIYLWFSISSSMILPGNRPFFAFFVTINRIFLISMKILQFSRLLLSNGLPARKFFLKLQL